MWKLACKIQIRKKSQDADRPVTLTISTIQTDRMHARDAAIVGATLRQIRTTGVIDAGYQANGFEGRHGRPLRAITGFCIIRCQAIFHALQHNDKKKYKKRFI